MKIVMVRSPLQQASMELVKEWLGTETAYTNSNVLVKLRPHTHLVDEPSLDQLYKAAKVHELAFVYPSIEQMRTDIRMLLDLPGPKRVVVNGQRIDIEKHRPTKPLELLQTPNGATLRHYQQQLVDFTLERKRVGLFVDMGLGKTLATLASIDQLFQQGQISQNKPVLVIAPKMVALDTWAREAEKWGYDIDVLINIGLTKKKREALFQQARKVNKPTIMTTNPEQLPNLLKEFEYDIKPFDMIVVDELSMFKSAKSQRFENLQQFTQDIKYFVGLTGTPAPNSLLDIWSQMVVINPDVKYELGQSFFIYRNHFFSPGVTNPATGIVYSWNLKRGAEEIIYRKIEPYVISMRGNHLIDIPDVTYTNEYVHMTPKARQMYDVFDKEVRRQLKELDDKDDTVSVDMEGDEVVVHNTAILKSKLLQLATGAIYSSDSTPTDRHYTVFHDAKIDKLKEILDVATSPVLVFYNFISDLERAKQAIPNLTVLNTKDKNVNQVIQKWNNGEIPVLFANPKSTGHGLNLQDGGHTIVWFSLTWNNEIYRQANKRLHRSGQKHPVQIIHIVTKDTADEEILPRINKKEDGQQELLDVLQAD